jgi:hypothetical protein
VTTQLLADRVTLLSGHDDASVVPSRRQPLGVELTKVAHVEREQSSALRGSKLQLLLVSLLRHANIQGR